MDAWLSAAFLTAAPAPRDTIKFKVMPLTRRWLSPTLMAAALIAGGPHGLTNKTTAGGGPLDIDSQCDWAGGYNKGGCDAGGCDDERFCESFIKGAAGLVRRSDHCFDDFISPMLDPVFFEDPRNLTELRPIYINQWVPDVIGSDVPAGGSFAVYAAQFRIALTERLSLIATKDGYIVDDTEGALDTLLDDGFADVSAGLKYNLLRDPVAGRLLSLGTTYEIPILVKGFSTATPTIWAISGIANRSTAMGKPRSSTGHTTWMPG